MKLLSKITLGAMLVFFLLPPSTAHMQGLPGVTFNPLAPLRSFGGTIVSVIPCSGGSLQIGIIPAGLFPTFYIWTPLTVTKLYGPPIAISQQILGLADVPYVCFIGGGFFTSPVPLFGYRMTYIGTSAPGGSATKFLGF
jgi:hypothetical protein